MADNPSNPPEDAKKRNSAASSAIPAFYVDTWYLNTWKDHIRITFGETLDQNHYRTAVVLEWDDAERLATHIQEVIAKRKSQEETKPTGEQG